MAERKAAAKAAKGKSKQQKQKRAAPAYVLQHRLFHRWAAPAKVNGLDILHAAAPFGPTWQSALDAGVSVAVAMTCNDIAVIGASVPARTSPAVGGD